MIVDVTRTLDQELNANKWVSGRLHMREGSKERKTIKKTSKNEKLGILKFERRNDGRKRCDGRADDDGLYFVVVGNVAWMRGIPWVSVLNEEEGELCVLFGPLS